VEILGHGTGIHWPDLDFDLYVPSLLRVSTAPSAGWRR
jgi:hypothetical protein